MPFIVNMPVNISRVPCSNPAGNYNNTATFFNPTYKFAAVIAFVCQNQFVL